LPTRLDPVALRVVRYARGMSAFPGLDVCVHSSHVDMFGHVNHTRYLEYMEWCRFAWADHHGFPIPAMIERDRVAPAILRVQIQYRRECRYGDRLRVRAEALSARRMIGRIKQTIHAILPDGSDGELVADAELTFVMLNIDTRKASPLVPMFLALLPVGD
jgi:thioesterase-3